MESRAFSILSNCELLNCYDSIHIHACNVHSHFQQCKDLLSLSLFVPLLGSPIAMAKNLFRLSGSHLRDLTPSPQSSPILWRRKLKAGSRGSSFESEFLYPWMSDSSGDEVTHWQEVTECDGQWVYFWHALRPKLKAAYTS